MQYLDEIDEMAKLIGAVNTVHIKMVNYMDIIQMLLVYQSITKGNVE